MTVHISIQNSVVTNCQSLKYQRLWLSGCKDKGIKKIKFVASDFRQVSFVKFAKSFIKK